VCGKHEIHTVLRLREREREKTIISSFAIVPLRWTGSMKRGNDVDGSTNRLGPGQEVHYLTALPLKFPKFT
jgi:hypothetical protein